MSEEQRPAMIRGRLNFVTGLRLDVRKETRRYNFTGVPTDFVVRVYRIVSDQPLLASHASVAT